MEKKKYVWIQLKVDEEFKGLVQALAKREERSMTQAIKVAVKDYVKRLEQPLKIEITPRHRKLPIK